MAVLITSAASLALTAMAFPAEQRPGFTGGMLLLAAVYALLGMRLGFLLGRVAGVLIAFVVPFLGLGITQSPMLRLEPPEPAVLLPGYGPYRLLIDTGLTEELDETGGLLIGLGWVAALTVVVTIMFVDRTSTARRRARAAKHPSAVRGRIRMTSCRGVRFVPARISGSKGPTFGVDAALNCRATMGDPR
ncbi:hypothetical protein AVP42_02608 [Agromyces sp. NDB4Y10]|nr:hypothetical protein AVP42_02608 [Agromyces sp. NDB4Y10]